jgi:hypothetical protein
MVYLQINGRFQTHILDFGRPNRYCQHIYIDFHTCSQKTRSGWFIYKSTDNFERTYSILADQTGTVNISTSISTHALWRLGQDGLSTNQQTVSNAHIRFWLPQPVMSTYLHRFPHVFWKTGSGWFVYKSTVSSENTYSILTDPTGAVNISTSISTRVLGRLVLDGLSTNQQSVSSTNIRVWPTQLVLSTYLHRLPHMLLED